MAKGYAPAISAAYDLATKGRLVIGTQLRGTGAMMLAMLAANQVANFMTRGHSTFDNKEEGWDSKLSAWIPDEIGNGPGFFISPFSLSAEITHQLLERLTRTGRLDQAADDVLRYKLSPASRAARVLAVREDQFGKATQGTWGTIREAASEGVPLPIGASAFYRGTEQVAEGMPHERFPGQFQKQVMASFGIKSRGAPNPEQRISALAREFMARSGVQDESAAVHSPYTPFMRAVDIGNKDEAQDELARLRQATDEHSIITYLARYPMRFATGSRAGDAIFIRTLTPEQKQAYNDRLKHNAALAAKAMIYVREHPPAPAERLPNKLQRMASTARTMQTIE